MRSFVLALTLLLSLAPRAFAQLETVATVAPVHALVARVMAGAGAPYLLVPPGASPHQVALRPSDAAALDRAALVFRVGPGIEPWLDLSLSTLASGARVVRLDRVPGLTRLPLDEPDDPGQAGADGQGGGEGGGEGDGERRDEAQARDDAVNPHLWLDPENAKLWLDAIAAALAGADPANARLYAANARAARDELDALQAEIAARLAPVRGRPFVVFHDAYRYFEKRFGIEAVGAVTLSDARTPGPARIAALRALIRETGAACVFREPQFRPALVATVAEGGGARVGVLDPIGANLEPGPGLYPALLRGLADGLAACLG